MKSRNFSLIMTWLIALATSASGQTTPTLLFKDDFTAANGTSLTDPATRATGTLASTVKYEWTGTANLTTQDVIVDGTLNWDSNGNRDGLHRQSGDTSVQNFRMTYNWYPQVAGRVWEVEFDQRVANANPLTFGLSDSAQNGSWSAWNDTNYDFAASSFVRGLYYDTDNDDGGTGNTNPTQVVDVFPALVATNPPSNQMHHFRIRFDEPNRTATVWINGVQKAQVASLDFENAGRYLSWGEPHTYAGALDNITVSVTESPPTIVSYNPAQAATSVNPAATLVATFSYAITLTGAGSITIQDMAGTNDVAINVTDPAQVSVSGTNLIITPPARLAYGHPFKVVIGPGTVGNFSAETTAAQWTFTTAVQEFTPPIITLQNPVDGGLKVARSANLTATFDQNITAGSGNIIIVDTDNNTTTRTIAVTDTTQVSFAGKVLTIDPTAPLTLGKHYAVQIAAGAIKNYSDIPFAGIPNSDVTTWNFAIIDPLKIMPMGDSITVGGTNAGWAEPYWYGYRSVLYNLLHGAGYNFVFVGQSTGLLSHFANTTPPADLAALGQNAHNGEGGKDVTYLNANILTWLAADDPDVILLKIGTNGLDTTGLDTLVNTITTTKPNVHLIIAQIIPKYTYDARVVNYNAYIRDTLVPYYQGLGKKVTLVDQYAPFLTNPDDLTSINQSLFSNGVNHPTNVGYAKMAQVWFNQIKALGIGPEIFANWISDGDFQIAPGDQGLNSDPDGDGISNGVENYFGTDPGKFSSGLVPVTANAGAGTFTFTHPLNPTRAENLTATYRWSKDLSTFNAGGEWINGSTVNFTQSAPSGGFVTVTATVTGAPLDKLFVHVRVTQN